MTTTTLEVEELLPEQTPDPIRIASRSTVDSQILDMGINTGWTCNVRLEHPYGTVIGEQTPITNRIQVEGLDRFNVKIPISWADLLTDLEETYWLIIKTRNDALEQRDVHIQPLKVTLSPTVEVDEDAALIEAAAALDPATGPTELPNPAPTTAELKNFALIGEEWQDQENEPGRVDPDESIWRFRWLARQPNSIRNSINAILAWAETSNAGESEVDSAFQQWQAQDPARADLTPSDWVQSSSNLDNAGTF